MRSIFLGLAAVAGFGLASVAVADRTVVFSTSNSTVSGATFHSLSDGGCTIEICGIVVQSDGGIGYNKCTAETPLSGTALTHCLTILQDATNSFKNSEGL